MTHTRWTVCLLFLIVFLTGCVCGLNVSVWQTPRLIVAAAGERVDITCHFTVRTSQGGRWRVEWRKNNATEFPNEVYHISDIKPNVLTEVNKSSTLSLHSLNVSHSGIYYCRVWQELPGLGPKTDGNGTELTVVNTRGDPSIITPNITPPAEVVESVTWMLLLVLALIIICVTSVICLRHRGHSTRQKQKKESQSVQTDDNGVVYAAVKIHKRHENKNTQEVSEELDDNGVVYAGLKIHKRHENKNTQEVSEELDAGCSVTHEVLYSKIHRKP
ncbi:uncharacterized protein si:dkey-63d15.12 [Neoarius graeffei]|uniref:uncharacterized protein si:dkey-63d15.12 n=1 Tax=Neoarius graeffei TaxID=443677 RepID=UPI00298C132A|nr:uncharacterized protein si:dkey-63d15.12 [Neoarius graeffei]